MLLRQRTNHADQRQEPQKINMRVMTSQYETGGKKPNIMLGHNVIYVDTICLCGLHGWSSDSHQSNSLSRANHFYRPEGVFV